MTTAGDRAEADRLARLLVEQRLAACVQLLPIDSVYRWKGAVETAAEMLLLAKTRAGLAEAAIAALKAVHSYDTPEIIVLPVTAGLPAYLDWIEAETG
ncbi:MAG: divalent-cation tolerance protein CutA [Caulobacteraceae bacterium]|nr:divalent-cation tolerance protein CutA [Caulobacteraceae bacterium]